MSYPLTRIAFPTYIRSAIRVVYSYFKTDALVLITLIIDNGLEKFLSLVLTKIRLINLKSFFFAFQNPLI